MAFTYDITTDRGKVRWRVGDTVDSGHDLEDAEIDAVLAETTNLDIAAVRCCEAIIAKLSRTAIDRSTAGINSSRSQKFQQTKDLLAELRKRVASGGGGMTAYAGGTSKSRNETIRQDTDFPTPPFAVERDSNKAGDEAVDD